MLQQLGIFGNISAFAYRLKETEKNCVEVAARRVFRILISSQQSGIWSKNSNTQNVEQIHTGWQLYTQGNYNSTQKTTKDNKLKTLPYYILISAVSFTLFQIRQKLRKNKKHRMCSFMFKTFSVKCFLF